MCYTSGTTGKPKGVVYSHRSQVLHSLAQAMPDAVGMSGRDVLLPVVPMFHANAWGIPYTAAMLGVKMVFPGPHLHPDDLLPLLESEQVTISCGVPTIWLPMVQILEKNPGKWKLHPALRLTVGGSAVPGSDDPRLRQAGDPDHSGLGHDRDVAGRQHLQDHRAAGRHLTEDQRFAVLATQGYPLPLVDIRAIGDDGEQPWDGKSVGEIQVHGPWITGSYYNQASARELRARMAGCAPVTSLPSIPFGFIKITDRTKDLIKSGGEWISSVDLENAIMGHPAVLECAVIAVAASQVGRAPAGRDRAQARRAGDRSRHQDLPVAEVREVDGARTPTSSSDAIPRTSTGKFSQDQAARAVSRVEVG